MPKLVQASYVKFVDLIHNNVRTGNELQLTALEQYQLEGASLSFSKDKDKLVEALNNKDQLEAERLLQYLYLQLDGAAVNLYKEVSEKALETFITAAIKFLAICTESVFEDISAIKVKEYITSGMLNTVIDQSTTMRDVMQHIYRNIQMINGEEEVPYPEIGNALTTADSFKHLYKTSEGFERAKGTAVGVTASNIFGSGIDTYEFMGVEAVIGGNVAEDRGPTTPFKAQDVDQYAYSFESPTRRVLGAVSPYVDDVVAQIELYVKVLKPTEKEYLPKISHMFKTWRDGGFTHESYHHIYDNGIQYSRFFGAAVVSMIVNSNLTDEEKVLLLHHTTTYDYAEFEYDALTKSVLEQCIKLAGCSIENSFPIYKEALKKRAQQITDEQISKSIYNSFPPNFYMGLGGKL